MHTLTTSSADRKQGYARGRGGGVLTVFVLSAKGFFPSTELTNKRCVSVCFIHRGDLNIAKFKPYKPG